MQFDLDDGIFEVPLDQQTDNFVEAVYAEAEATLRERGLLAAEGAGSLVVATQVERPDLRQELLDNVDEGAQLYIETIEGINQFRETKNHIRTLRVEDYRERSKDLLTNGMVSAAGQLPATAKLPRLLIPRLNQPITREETVQAWKFAAGNKIWQWGDRMKFLNQFTANQLSGFDPAVQGQVEFEVVPTAEDTARKGNVEQQNDRLKALKKDFPELNVATIFSGAVLARRCLEQPRPSRDSNVKAINLRPVKGRDGVKCVPYAFVSNHGGAEVGGNDVQTDNPARLLVRRKISLYY